MPNLFNRSNGRSHVTKLHNVTFWLVVNCDRMWLWLEFLMVKPWGKICRHNLHLSQSWFVERAVPGLYHYVDTPSLNQLGVVKSSSRQRATPWLLHFPPNVVRWCQGSLDLLITHLAPASCCHLSQLLILHISRLWLDSTRTPAFQIRLDP